MKTLRIGLSLVAAVGLLAALAGGAAARPPLQEAGMAIKRSVTADVAGYDRQHGPHSQFECIAASGGANTNLDCDDPFPNNEPNIEVDPVAPGHMIASSNDYGSCCDQFYTTLDNAATWTTGNMSREQPAADRQRPRHRVRPQARDGDPLVAELLVPESDGRGLPRRPGRLRLDRRRDHVAAGGGRRLRVRLRSLEHAGLQRQGVDRHRQQPGLAVLRPDIPDLVEVRSPRAGSTSRRRSSSRTPTTAASTGRRRRRSRAPTRRSARSRRAARPASATRTSSLSPRSARTARSTSPSRTSRTRRSGRPASSSITSISWSSRRTAAGTWSSPTFIVGLEDGSADYPINVGGRQTLTGYQLRVNSAGNIVASPTDGKLYLVFSDNRNGVARRGEPGHEHRRLPDGFGERRRHLERRRRSSIRPRATSGSRGWT